MGAAVYLGVVAAILLAFFYLGFPLSVALRLGAGDPFGFRAMSLGMALFVLLAWHWVTITGTGTDTFVVVLGAANLPAFGWAIRKKILAVGRPDFRRMANALAAPALITVSCWAVFSRYFSDTTARPFLRPSSIYNNDLPYYALMSQHLQIHGFNDPSRIPGFPAGLGERIDVFGAFSLVAGLARALQLDPARVLLPVTLACAILLAGLIAQLLKETLAIGRWTAVVIGVASTSTSIYYYILGQGFLGQVIGMPLFASLVVCLSSVRPAMGVWAGTRLAIEFGVVAAGLLMVYPHMAFLGLPILVGYFTLPALAQSTERTVWVRRGCVLAAGALAGGLFAGTRTNIAIDRTFGLEGSLAGWAFKRISFDEILGYKFFPQQRRFAPTVSDHAAALEAVNFRGVGVVLVIAAMAGLLLRKAWPSLSPEHRTGLTWGIALAAVSAASYYAFFGYVGPGYQQWKWLTFTQPLLVAGFLASLVTLIAAQFGTGTRHAWFRRGAIAGTLAVSLAVTLSVEVVPHGSQVSAAMVSVDSMAGLRGARGVNVRVERHTHPWVAGWDAMWITYYLRKRNVVITSPYSYFPPIAPDPHFPTVVENARGELVLEPAALPGGGT